MKVLFDNIDKLYGSATGGTATQAAASGEVTSPTPGGEEFPAAPEAGAESPIPPAPEAGAEAPAGVTPESKKKDMNILVENNFIEGSEIIDLSHGQDSLGEISKELDKLLNS